MTNTRPFSVIPAAGGFLLRDGDHERWVERHELVVFVAQAEGVLVMKRCPACQRPMGQAVCPRCAEGVEDLARAVCAATEGRATFLECYAFAKTVAAREANDKVYDDAVAAAFEDVQCDCPDFFERHHAHGPDCPVSQRRATA